MSDSKFKTGDIIIPEGAVYPKHVLVVEKYDELGCLCAHPLSDDNVRENHHHFVKGAEVNFRLVTESDKQERSFQP
jgi:hypothetical protein